MSKVIKFISRKGQEEPQTGGAKLTHQRCVIQVCSRGSVGRKNKIYSQEGSGGASNWGNLGSRGSVGINAMVSVVLLLATVIVLSVIVMNFATTLIKKEARVVENRSTACLNRDVSIEDVYVDTSASVARVSVRNSGFVADSIVSAVLLNKKGEISSNTTQFPLALAKGALSNIEFNVSGKITACTNFSKVIISTECASDETDAEPKCVS